MSPELDHQLCEKYPKIFADRYKSKEESCLYWGIEVGDGWFELLDTLCAALTCLYETSIEITDEQDGLRYGCVVHYWDKAKPSYYFNVKPPQVVAAQVKPKFGSLRFYYDLEFDDANKELVASGKYPELAKINAQYSEYIQGIVHFAEIASTRTCEVTGKKGELCVRNGWLKTLSRDLIQTKEYEGYKPHKDTALQA